MSFSIKSQQADELLAAVRDLTGEGITEAVVHALEARLTELRSPTRVGDVDWMWHLSELQAHYRHLRRQPTEPTDESLMYDGEGLPA